MKYNQIISEYNQIISETQNSKYILFPGLPQQNYQLGLFSKIDEWKAKIILANSAGEGQDIGQWDAVGYVMISLTTNEIIPIARADEHKSGYDLLYYFKDKKKIKLNPKDFIPLYKGENFVYGTDSIDKMIIVAKKWLEWGGPNELVRGAYAANGLFGKLSDLVKYGLKMMPQSGKLNISGERLINNLRNFGSLNTKYILMTREGARSTEALEKTIFRTAKIIAHEVIPIMEYLWIEKTKHILVQIQKLEDNNDLQGLSEFFFGFHGIKNEIHQTVREALAGKGIRIEQVKSVFGDLELANGLLANL